MGVYMYVLLTESEGGGGPPAASLGVKAIDA